MKTTQWILCSVCRHCQHVGLAHNTKYKGTNNPQHITAIILTLNQSWTDIMQTLTPVSSHRTWSDQKTSLAILLSKKATLQAAETNSSASPCLEQTSILESLKHCSYFLYFFIHLWKSCWGKEDCASWTTWVGVKNPRIQQQVTLLTIWIFTLQLRFAVAGQMCQTCCLGFSQHRQEGGMSSSCPCKEALVMFTWEANRRNCPTANN